MNATKISRLEKGKKYIAKDLSSKDQDDQIVTILSIIKDIRRKNKDFNQNIEKNPFYIIQVELEDGTKDKWYLQDNDNVFYPIIKNSKLKEMNTTGDVAGYDTKNAFGKNKNYKFANDHPVKESIGDIYFDESETEEMPNYSITDFLSVDQVENETIKNADALQQEIDIESMLNAVLFSLLDAYKTIRANQTSIDSSNQGIKKKIDYIKAIANKINI